MDGDGLRRIEREMSGARSPSATRCVNRADPLLGAVSLFARETTELFKWLAECAGADRFIGRRIGRLTLICAATTRNHGRSRACCDAQWDSRSVVLRTDGCQLARNRSFAPRYDRRRWLHNG